MSNPSSSMEIRTRQQFRTRMEDVVGHGKDFIPSEVPTLRAVIQKGILIRERLLQQGTAQTYIHVNDIVKELVPLIQAQWIRSNAKFCYPVTIYKKVAKLWLM